MIFKAIEFATKAHTGQYRKGTKIPYIVHPLGVARTLIELGCSEEIIVAGLLHDTVEDTPVSLADIKFSFGDEVLRLVEAASEPDKSASWEDRKRHTIEYLKIAPADVLLVTCADKLDNIRSIREDYEKIGESLWSRFNRPKEKQAWYFQSLAEVFAGRADGEPGATLFGWFQAEVEKVFGK